MRLKKFLNSAIFFVLLGSSICFFSACGNNYKNSDGAASVSSSSISKGSSNSSSSSSTEGSQKEQKSLSSFQTYEKVKDQTAPPQKGEEIAILTVKIPEAGEDKDGPEEKFYEGKIKCRLFEKAAPKAVKNFKEIARSGKYKNSPFHRVIEDFIIQTGIVENSGPDDKDNSKVKGFEVELNQSLRHINGALCMARTDDLKNGQDSQFYIVSSEVGKTADLDKIASGEPIKYMGNKTSSSEVKKMQNPNELPKKRIVRSRGKEFQIELPKYSEEDKKKYKELGGYPALDMDYTVFGQVFEGMDVVKKIASCKKSETASPMGEKCIPEQKITLENVEIVKY